MMINMKRVSLAVKLALLVSVIAVGITTVAVIVSYRSHCTAEDRYYKEMVSRIANTAASQLEKDRVELLVEAAQDEKLQQLSLKGDGAAVENWLMGKGLYDDYKAIRDQLESIRAGMEIKDIYLQTQIDQTSIAIVDPVESVSSFGYPTENEPEFAQYNSNIRIPATVSDGEYGWLCSGYEVFYNEAGEAIATVGVDISMDRIMEIRFRYLGKLALSMTSLMVLLGALMVWYSRRQIVVPVQKLTQAAEGFLRSEKENDDGGSTLSEPMELDIHTGDEIETLYHTIRTMEININEYTQDLMAVTAEKERIGAELNVATKIQSDMLPSIFPAFPERHEFEIYATMTPAKEVGGDFYDFFLVDDKHLAMVIADVSGKGVPAALFMVISKTLLKNALMLGMTPKQALESVNNQLCENNESYMFVTVWAGIMDIDTGKVVAANAGHEYPAIRKAGGEFGLIKDKHGIPLGCMEGSVYTQYEFEIESGETVYVYTDGVAEATDSAYQLYGTDRMLTALNREPDAVPQQLLANVAKGIEEFVGEAPQFDDITMLALKRS